MSEENAEQIEHWNGESGARWVEAQARMDALLAPLSRVLLERAAARGGERVVDVGCGCGDTSLALSGVGAQVLGIDVSGPMLGRARERCEGRYGLRFVHADAVDHPFEASSFDLLVSRFGVMFFADPVRAFSNLRRGHAKDGRVCFLSWQAAEHNPWFALPMQVLQPFLPEAEPVAPDAPGPFAFADRERVESILTAAGYHEVSVEPVEQALRYGDDAEDAMTLVRQLGPAARGLAALSPESQADALQALHEALRAAQTPDGVVLPSASWLVTARVNKR